MLAALIDAGASTLPKGDTSAERDQLARLAAAYRERHGHDPVLATHDARAANWTRARPSPASRAAWTIRPTSNGKRR